ncbi:MAG: serine/threonine-protein kinase [Planctomycetota bacterium]|nr:serine/threonine-protein kinase [Planctomycetota bacterium]
MDVNQGQIQVLLHYKYIQEAEISQLQHQALNTGMDIATFLQRSGRLTQEQVNFVNDQFSQDRSGAVKGHNSSSLTVQKPASGPIGSRALSAGTKSTVIGESIGRYKILKELGRGGMGVVYKAFDPKLSRELAIKVMAVNDKLQESERFHREATAVAQFRHPNIVQVYEFGDLPDGREYIAMDFLPGRSLKELVDRSELGPWEASEILEKVARAVDHAHSKGILHRDIKPHNILMTDGDREPVLLDFGLARMDKLRVPGSQSLTEEGMVLGTLAYMPPEQADGQAVTELADVYGLGATFYYTLTGEAPFAGSGSNVVLMNKIFNEDVKAPNLVTKGIPKDLSDLCLKSLAKEPEDRPQSALEFADFIAAARLEPTSKNFSMTVLALFFLFVSVFAVLAYLLIPKTGSIRLTVDADDVQLRVGEKLVRLKRGISKTFDLPVGPQKLELEREGVPFEQLVNINGGELHSETLSLTKTISIELRGHDGKKDIELTNGEFSVFSRAGELAYEDDGQPLDKLKSNRAVTIAIGRYVVKARAFKHYPMTHEIVVDPNTKRIKLTLKREEVVLDKLLPYCKGFQNHPICLELDGDGIQDMILRLSTPEGGGYAHYVAISGKDGKVIWRNRGHFGIWSRAIRIQFAGKELLGAGRLSSINQPQVAFIDMKTGRDAIVFDLPPNLQPRSGSPGGTAGGLGVLSKKPGEFLVIARASEKQWVLNLNTQKIRLTMPGDFNRTIGDCALDCGAFIYKKDSTLVFVSWKGESKELFEYQHKTRTFHSLRKHSLTNQLPMYDMTMGPDGDSFFAYPHRNDSRVRGSCVFYLGKFSSPELKRIVKKGGQNAAMAWIEKETEAFVVTAYRIGSDFELNLLDRSNKSLSSKSWPNQGDLAMTVMRNGQKRPLLILNFSYSMYIVDPFDNFRTLWSLTKRPRWKRYCARDLNGDGQDSLILMEGENRLRVINPAFDE